jgi:hypothetical protein
MKIVLHTSIRKYFFLNHTQITKSEPTTKQIVSGKDEPNIVLMQKS